MEVRGKIGAAKVTASADSFIPFFRSEGKPTTLSVNEFIKSNSESLSGPGELSREVEKLLCEKQGTKMSLLTPSGTSALELATLLMEIQSGDEIIMPSWTFASTANAFILRGAKIIFVDIEPWTLNMDPVKVEAAISKRTRCIVTINYAGIPGELELFRELANSNELLLLEDNAHGFGGKIGEKPLGSFGNMAAQSCHQTKNLQCGEGGALSINDEQFLTRAEVLREKGTNRKQFLEGMVDKYTWQDFGSSFVLSEILAQYLKSNLETFEESQVRRLQIWKRYESISKDKLESLGVSVPQVGIGITPSCHAYWLIFSNFQDSNSFIKYMKAWGIEVSRHYVPLHNSPAALKFDTFTPGAMLVTEQTGDCLVRLPLYSKLNDSEVEQIITAVKDFSC